MYAGSPAPLVFTSPSTLQIILIPGLAGQTCLILNDTLTTTQLSHCTQMTGRSYGTFDHHINGVGYLTGANTLDVAKIGIDDSLLNLNVSMLTDAYGRVHSELSIKTQVKADGIRPDGSFGNYIIHIHFLCDIDCT
jgi:hypothetical protein